MKVAIVGGTGLLGSNLLKLYNALKIEVKAFSRSASNNIESISHNIIDFDKLELELNYYFKTWQPDIIINAIALVNLNECENQKVDCYKINVEIAEKLAVVANANHSYYIHISTDHYYNDMFHKHTENDPIVLLNYYAETKRQAEKNVLNTYENSLVVRTNIIGFRNTETLSFFEWLHDALKNGTNIDLFTDFYTSPISVRELGKLFLKCHDNKLTGIYNIASSEVIDKYSFGMQVAKKFDLNDKYINKSTLKSFQKESNIKRASNLGLDVSKIEKALNTHMPSIDDTITELLNEYKERIYNEK